MLLIPFTETTCFVFLKIALTESVKTIESGLIIS